LKAPATIYDDPPTFDTNNATEANKAAEAVVAVLNAEGGIDAVGESDGVETVIFRVPWDVVELDVPVVGNVRLVKVWEGVTGDTSSPGVWGVPTDSDVFPFVDDGGFATFTLVSTGGAGNSPPVADAGGSYEGAVDVAVQFDGSGSSDRDGSIETYKWDFGDGKTAQGKKPQHVYANAGKYNVTLKVTDDAGAKDSDSTNADIGATSQPPVADAGGSYEGSVDANVEFDGSASSDSDGKIKKYKWDFGDGKTAKGKAPDHKYKESGKYTVTLTVTDDSGEKDSDTSQADVGEGNLPPKAKAGGSYEGKVDEKVEFDGSGSSDPDGKIKSYSWDFGDGKSDKAEDPDHKYKEAGTYTATLEVKDDDGAKDSDETTVVIK
jgi:PKD repeat protein